MNPFNWFSDKAKHLKSIIKLREFAIMKRAERPKKAKREKDPYQWGALGLSTVSAEIKKDHGVILSRRERKETAKATGTAFTRYYNN